MHFSELVAPPPQPIVPAYATLSPHVAAAPQRWHIALSNAKFHWYDLVSGFPAVPDIRDPVGRYLRRMQFDLEAAAEKHLVYFAVLRPRIRFDTARDPQWGFFSLKLTLPVIMGAERRASNIVIELKPPIGATLKKPTLTLNDTLLTLNWGGQVEVLSIHDVMQHYQNDLKIPGKVVHVGQTRDADARLSKGRVCALQKLQQQHGEYFDLLVLMQQVDLSVDCDYGDPADWPENQTLPALEALHRCRSDIVEGALIRYFEGPWMQTRSSVEKSARRERLRQVHAASQLQQMTIDLQPRHAGNFQNLFSEHAESACQHLFSCDIVDGEAIVTKLPLPVLPRAKKS
jgi:hypothetical protein